MVNLKCSSDPTETVPRLNVSRAPRVKSQGRPLMGLHLLLQLQLFATTKHRPSELCPLSLDLGLWTPSPSCLETSACLPGHRTRDYSLLEPLLTPLPGSGETKPHSMGLTLLTSEAYSSTESRWPLGHDNCPLGYLFLIPFNISCV